MRGLLKRSSAYLASTVITQASALILFPLYTRLLGPSQYGVLSLMLALGALLTTLVAAGLTTAVIKYHYRAEQGNGRSVFGSAIAFVAVLGAAAFIVGTAFREPLANLVAPDVAQSFARALPWTLAFAACNAVRAILLAEATAEERAGLYVISTMIGVLSSLGFAVVFVGLLDWGVQGAVIATCIGAAAPIPWVLGSLAGRRWWRIGSDALGTMLVFGLALTPMNLSGWVLELSDRYLLSHWVTAAELGRYSAAYRVGTLVTIICVLPFQTAFMPFMFGSVDTAEGPFVLGRVIRYFVAGCLAAVLVVSVFGRELLVVLAGSQYGSAAAIVPFSALAAFFLGLTVVSSPGIIARGNAYHGSAIFTAAAVVNVLLNLVLIPWIGIFGAAVSTGIAYAVLAVVYVFVSQRTYRCMVAVRPMVVSVAWLAFAGAGALLVVEVVPLGLLQLFLKASVVVGGMLAVALGGGLEPAERRRLVAGVRTSLAKGTHLADRVIGR